MRLKNILITFADFGWEDLSMPEQLFEDYKSKYLDLYDKVRSDHQKEKVSILEDVDFELELIHRDEINVSYILKLLANLIDDHSDDEGKKRKEIIDLLTGDVGLRSKRELIEKFIQENLPAITDTEDLPGEFDKFWNEEKIKAFQTLIEEEKLSKSRTEKLIEDYLYAERTPLRDEVLGIMDGVKPTILERKRVGDRILKKVMEFVEVFVRGMSG